MTKEEIQEIKDKAAREFEFDDWYHYADRMLLEPSDVLIIDRAIELASKREVKVPTNEEIYKKFPNSYVDEKWEWLRERNDYGIRGANWAIEKIRELNQ